MIASQKYSHRSQGHRARLIAVAVSLAALVTMIGPGQASAETRPGDAYTGWYLPFENQHAITCGPGDSDFKANCPFIAADSEAMIFSLNYGQPVYSIGPGVVVWSAGSYSQDYPNGCYAANGNSSNQYGYGGLVIVKHTPPGHDPVYTYYSHLSLREVSVNQSITDPSTEIGKAGISGCAFAYQGLAALQLSPRTGINEASPWGTGSGYNLQNLTGLDWVSGCPGCGVNIDGSGNGTVLADRNWGAITPPSPHPRPRPIRRQPTLVERNGGGSTSSNSINCSVGPPVNCATGDFWHSFSDVSIPGRGPTLDLTRTYNSLSSGLDGPFGFGWASTYTMSVRLDVGTGEATVSEENGAQLIFTPDGAGGFTTPSWVFASLSQNSDGSWTFIRHQRQQFLFNSGGQLTKVVDLNGYATTLSYDSSGHLTTVADPAGRVLTFSTDPAGRIGRAADPGGRFVSYSYDGAGNLTSVTDVGGGATRFTYDGAHLLLTMTDPNGGAVTNVYDGAARVVRQTDPLNRQTTFSYGSDGTTSITDPRGIVTSQHYDMGLLVSLTKGAGTPQAATWSYAYDPATFGIRSTTDPNGHVKSATYDARGNRTGGTDARGSQTTATFDLLNDQTSVTDPLGVTTTMAYDATGNLLSTSRPLTATAQIQKTSLTYGDSAHPGDVTSMTDPNGQVWSFAYDGAGDLVAQTDPMGEKTTTSFNVVGFAIASVAPNGNLPGADPTRFRTTTSYNNFGQPLSIVDPLARLTSFAYDANRNQVRTTDANGHPTGSTFDADNEPIQVTRADGTIVKTAYDADGNVVGQTNGLNQTTRYSYDPLNHPGGVTDPLGRLTRYRYDGVGNLLTLTDPQGQVTTRRYEAADQLIALTYSDGRTPNVAYSYDLDGQRRQMTDGTGTTTDTFDSLHRLTREVNGAGQAVGYGYDLKGQLTSLTYPGSGRVVTRAYDPAGRLASVADWLHDTTTFTYDANSNLIRQNYPNGIVGRRGYDAADQLLQIDYATPDPGSEHSAERHRKDDGFSLDLGYTRDQVGLLTSVDAEGAKQPDQTYSYDPLNQLTGVNKRGYQYDAAGNLTTMTKATGDGEGDRGHGNDADNAPGQTVTLTYDVASEIIKMMRQNKLTTFSYDSRGNRVRQTDPKGKVTSLGYDQANRLASYAATATYSYNGDGLRMGKTVSGNVEPFVWDTAEGMPLTIQDGPTAYVTGPQGLPLEQVSTSGRVVYFHADQLGSTLALTDTQGSQVASYAYDAYGNSAGSEKDNRNGDGQHDDGAPRNPFRFAGQYEDAESPLSYLRARYYDPVTGQFVSRDPAVAWTRSAYAYVAGNPTNATDPTGLCGWWNPFCYDSLAQHIVAGGGGSVAGSLIQGVQTIYAYDPNLRTLLIKRVVRAGAGASFITGGVLQAFEDSQQDLSAFQRVARIAISATVSAVIATFVVGLCAGFSAGFAAPACVILGALILGTVYDFISSWLFEILSLSAQSAKGGAVSGYAC